MKEPFKEPLVERVEIAMDLLTALKPPISGLSAGVQFVEALDEIHGILAGIRRDLYKMEESIAHVEDLAQQVFDTAEDTEIRLSRFLGGKKP